MSVLSSDAVSHLCVYNDDYKLFRINSTCQIHWNHTHFAFNSNFIYSSAWRQQRLNAGQIATSEIQQCGEDAFNCNSFNAGRVSSRVGTSDIRALKKTPRGICLPRFPGFLITHPIPYSQSISIRTDRKQIRNIFRGKRNHKTHSDHLMPRTSFVWWLVDLKFNIKVAVIINQFNSDFRATHETVFFAVLTESDCEMFEYEKH